MYQIKFAGAPNQRRTCVLGKKTNGSESRVVVFFWASRGTSLAAETPLIEGKSANGQEIVKPTPTREGFAKLVKKFEPPEVWFHEPDVF